ncbi:MAG: Stp1/IreP family PP2C-type Ser/Thr phosphatase [Anaerolineae bacterium]|nr:Stp1/IreP family PP2C-type Ser/Thr phosphatase [Anaerolineae bacterium]
MSRFKSFFQQLFNKTPSDVTSRTVSEAEAVPPVEVLPASVDNHVEVEDELSTAVSTTTELPPGPEVRHCGGSFATGWMTDVGKVRNHNEDALFVFTGEQAADEVLPPFGLFVLADGMGGHHAGEIASALAVQSAGAYLLSHVYQSVLTKSEQGGEQPSLSEAVQEAISYANREVTDDVPGSGSTLTCGMVLGSRMFMGHVGDSRAYLLRSGEQPRQLTNDHSLVNRLVEMGQLTLEEAAVHPQRNVLYRAVGQGESLDIDVFTIPLQYGDRVLLCSDGLWGMVEEEEMWHLISESPSVQSACVQLVAAANKAGGNDNITVILIEILYGKS